MRAIREILPIIQRDISAVELISAIGQHEENLLPKLVAGVSTCGENLCGASTLDPRRRTKYFLIP